MTIDADTIPTAVNALTVKLSCNTRVSSKKQKTFSSFNTQHQATMSKTRTEAQIQAFIRWVNSIVGCRGLEIESFPDDLKNGVILCHLAELLTKQKLKKFNSHPTLQAHELDNLGVAFKLLTKSSLRLVNVGPQDVHSGHVKCILGLLWSCIKKFQLITNDNHDNPINDKVVSPEQTC